MKVLVDTNVLLSYLLNSESSSAPVAVVNRLLSGHDDLILPEQVIDELTRTILEKPYFAERIAPQQVQRFVELLRTLSIPSPRPPSLDQRWVRDPKDDFLINAALLAGVDYLVSGDKDLIALGDALDPLKIRSPQAFIEEFGRSQPIDVD
jgi:putative PIN family toxin of toxin-antitoxin system